MIPLILREMTPRIAAVLLLCIPLYLLEPSFHQHGPVDPSMAAELGPLGASAALAYLAALSMIALLAGFIARDYREDYASILFSHPTSPLAYYGLRWLLALGVTMVIAALFLVVGQVVAWGELRGGGAGLLLALLAAGVYGGLMAFFSAVLRKGDGWIVLLLFLPTLAPQLLDALGRILPAGVHSLLLFLLPPQGALQEVWRGLLLGMIPWGAAGFALGYGVAWIALAAAVLMLRSRVSD